MCCLSKRAVQLLVKSLPCEPYGAALRYPAPNFHRCLNTKCRHNLLAVGAWHRPCVYLQCGVLSWKLPAQCWLTESGTCKSSLSLFIWTCPSQTPSESDLA